MPEIPDQPAINTDDLPPTQYLILEVLAARHRTGEALWTFPSRLRGALRELAYLGLVGHKSGVAPATERAWLTDAGLRSALMEGFETPINKEREAAYRAGLEAAARAIEEFAAKRRAEMALWPPHSIAGLESNRPVLAAYAAAAEVARGEFLPTEEQRND